MVAANPRGTRVGNSAGCTTSHLSPKRSRIYHLYWVEGWSQPDIAGEMYISQQGVSKHIQAIRRSYQLIGVTLPTPKTREQPPKPLRGPARHSSEGAIQIDVCRIANQLRGLGKLTRRKAPSDALILGTLLNAIDDERLHNEVCRLVGG